MKIFNILLEKTLYQKIKSLEYYRRKYKDRYKLSKSKKYKYKIKNINNKLNKLRNERDKIKNKKHDKIARYVYKKFKYKI